MKEYIRAQQHLGVLKNSWGARATRGVVCDVKTSAYHVQVQALEQDILGGWRPERPRAPRHELPSEERARVPRRRAKQGQAQGGNGATAAARQPPRARRCLAAAFAEAADAVRLAPLDLTPTHSACLLPAFPCQTPPPAHPHPPRDLSPSDTVSTSCIKAERLERGCVVVDAQRLSAQRWQECWQPCQLAEALAGAPGGLPDEAARAVVAAVAFALEALHADGLVHRHVCAHTVHLGERACFDTARRARCPILSPS